jgi:hypothetical protein
MAEAASFHRSLALVLQTQCRHAKPAVLERPSAAWRHANWPPVPIAKNAIGAVIEARTRYHEQ